MEPGGGWSVQLAGLAVVDWGAGKTAGEPAGELVPAGEPVPGEGLAPPAAPFGVGPGAGGCSVAAGTAGDGLVLAAAVAPEGHRLQVAAQ